jgi:DNA-binding MarR family transcriptional regulator
MVRSKSELNYSNIFESVEFPDAYKVSYLANAIVFPTYEDVRKDFGLVRAEYHLLLCLAHYSELTAQDVARITRRPRNSISRAVHRMLDLGFLKRVPDPSDARQAKLQITKEGKIMHNKISKYLVSREAEIFSVLSESERKHFRGLIRKLANFASTLKR